VGLPPGQANPTAYAVDPPDRRGAAPPVAACRVRSTCLPSAPSRRDCRSTENDHDQHDDAEPARSNTCAFARIAFTMFAMDAMFTPDRINSMCQGKTFIWPPHRLRHGRRPARNQPPGRAQGVLHTSSPPTKFFTRLNPENTSLPGFRQAQLIDEAYCLTTPTDG